LLVARIIEGCGFLAVIIAIPPFIRALADQRDHAFALACWGAYMPVGSAIIMLAAPSLMVFGWRFLWLLDGTLTVLYAIFIALSVRGHSSGSAGTSAVIADIKTVMVSPGPVLGAIAFGIYSFHYFALTGLLPTLLIDRMGLTVAQAGSISAATVVANAVGNFAAGAALRFGIPLWTIISTAFVCCGIASIGIFSQSVPVALVAILASASLAITGLIPASLFAATARFAPAATLLGITLGIFTQASNLGQLLGPAALGAWVERFGWSSAPILFAAIALVGIVIALRLRTVLQRSSAQAA
jgi:predicted MFS family arabinose efflux permease